MKIAYFIAFLLVSLGLLVFVGLMKMDQPKSIPFEAIQWRTTTYAESKIRLAMHEDLIAIDSIRYFDKMKIITTLGSPDRINDNFLYYTLSQKKLGLWPLHTKTLVIKMKDDQKSIEWIKISE